MSLDPEFGSKRAKSYFGLKPTLEAMLWMPLEFFFFKFVLDLLSFQNFLVPLSHISLNYLPSIFGAFF